MRLGSRNVRAWRGELLHRLGELEVARRDPAGVMSGEVDDHPVVHVEPLGVVVAALGDERYGGHEAERLDEAVKFVLAVQLAFFERPAGQGGERALDLRSRELGDGHWVLLSGASI